MTMNHRIPWERNSRTGSERPCPTSPAADSLAEGARRANVHRSTIYNWMEDDDFPCRAQPRPNRNGRPRPGRDAGNHAQGRRRRRPGLEGEISPVKLRAALGESAPSSRSDTASPRKAPQPHRRRPLHAQERVRGTQTVNADSAPSNRALVRQRAARAVYEFVGRSRRTLAPGRRPHAAIGLVVGPRQPALGPRCRTPHDARCHRSPRVLHEKRRAARSQRPHIHHGPLDRPAHQVNPPVHHRHDERRSHNPPPPSSREGTPLHNCHTGESRYPEGWGLN